LQRTIHPGKPLLVAQLDPAEVEDGVLHGAHDALALAALFTMEQGGQDASDQMDAGAGVADLGAGHHRKAVDLAGRRRRPSGALGDVLVHLAVLEGPRAESLHRRVDHPRVDLLDLLPREAHAIDGAGREVLHHHVALLDQPGEDLVAGFGLGVQRQAALVGVEHREVEAVDVR
jgi:hypothetical protein